MPGKEDDVLNILNTNTQNNNYNSGRDSDDVLNVLNDNSQNLNVNNKSNNSYDINLSDTENNARRQGYLERQSGIQRTEAHNTNLHHKKT